MKSSLLTAALLFSSFICAMDIQEVPVQDAQKLQLNAPDQKITSEQLAKRLKTSPRLQEINITGHTLEKLPTAFFAHHLIKIDLNNGPLNDNDTVKHLLTSCKNLQHLYIANNKLTTLNEANFPIHNNLIVLDCRNNQIRELNFTTFREKVPYIQELNLSDCPLEIFDIQGLSASYSIPMVQLERTSLSDDAKKKIIAACKTFYPNVSLQQNASTLTAKDKISVLVISAIGATILVCSTILPLHYLNPSSVAEDLAIIVPGFATSMASEVGLHYACAIGCRKPQERESAFFKPIFDTIPTYTEEEVTTRYQRFIRHFPYFFSRCQGDDGDDLTNITLTHISTTE